MYRKIVSTVLSVLLLLGQVPDLFIPYSRIARAEEVLHSFMQTDWSGGASAQTVAHPANQTGWNRYQAKDEKIVTEFPGRTYLSTVTDTRIFDTDADFSNGTLVDAQISGTGEEAIIEQVPQVTDPFVSDLRVWAPPNVPPRAPDYGAAYAYVSSQNSVYAFWGMGQRIFWMWDLDEEEWVKKAPAPEAVSYGACLTYPGSGDYIYALRGGSFRDFWRYNISEDEWEELGQTPYDVNNGTSMKIAPAYGLIFISFGSAGPEFSYELYRYTISSGAWVRETSVPAYVGYGSQLLYPDSGSHLYFLRGQNTITFYKYNWASKQWNAAADGGNPSDVPSSGMPNSGRIHNGSAAIYRPADNAFYVAVGANIQGIIKYSIDTDTWTREKDAPWRFYPGSGMVYADVDDTGQAVDTLYAFYGGQIRPSSYSFSQGKWEQITPHSSYIDYGAAGAYYDGEIFLLRGRNTQTFHKYNITDNQWQGLASIPTSPGGRRVHRGGAMTVNPASGLIYAIKGYERGDFYHYDPGADSWITLATAPQAFYYGADLAYVHRTATPQRYVYALRGYNARGFMRFKINDNTWETLADTPATVSYGGSLAYPGGTGGNYLYALRGSHGVPTADGYQNADGQADFWRYNISEGVWEPDAVANPPYRIREGGRLISDGTHTNAGNYLYAIAGRNSALFMRYNISTNTWEELPQMPRYIGDGAGLVYDTANNQVYVWEGNYRVNLMRYDIVTQAWTEPSVDIIDVTSAVYSLRSDHFWDGMHFIVPGGDIVYLAQGALMRYFWPYSVSQDKWFPPIKAPFSLGYGMASVVIDSDTVYFAQGQRTPFFWKWQPSTNTWTQLEDINNGAGLKDRVGWGSALSYVPGWDKIYCLVGNTSEHLRSYDLISNTWSSEPVCPAYMSRSSMVYQGTGNSLYVLRGYNSQTFHKLDISTGIWTALDGPGENVDYGSGLYYPGTGDYAYLLPHRYSQGFRRFSFTSEEWERMADTPAPQRDSRSTMFYPGDGDVLYILHSEFYRGRRPAMHKYLISQDVWDSAQIPRSYAYRDGAGVYVEKERAIYVARGNNSTAFTRYLPDENTWEDLAPAPMVTRRTALAFDTRAESNYIYAMRAYGQREFWRYDIDADNWESRAFLPQATWSGALCYPRDSRYLYALRGENTPAFWKYDTLTNGWSDLPNAPWNTSLGSIIYPGTGDYLYVFRGAWSKDFAKFDISNDTWVDAALAPPPGPFSPRQHGVVYPGFGDYIYTIRVGTYRDVWRYSISQDEWEALPDTPFDIHDESSIFYGGDGFLYLMRAQLNGETDFYRIQIASVGEYTSPAFDIGKNRGYGLIDWQAEGDVHVKVRTATASTMQGARAWDACPRVSKQSDLSTYASVIDTNTFAQYHVRLITDDIDMPASMDNLAINWEYYPHIQELVSSPYDTTQAHNRLMQVGWDGTVLAGTDLRMHLRTAPDEAGEPGAWGPWLGPAGTQTFTDDYTIAGDYAMAPEIEVIGGTARLKKILQDYAYTQRVVLDNSADEKSYTDIVIGIEIGPDNKDFWENILPDGADVRFLSADGNLLSYNLHTHGAEFDYANQYAKIFARIPSIPAQSKVSIYLKYGKEDAVSASDEEVIAIPRPNSLVGWWRFDEGAGSTAMDNSESSNTLTLVNNPTWVTGKINKALQFNGLNQYTRINSNPTLQMGGLAGFTLGAWIKIGTIQGRMTVISKHYNEYELMLESSATRLQLYKSSNSAATSYEAYSVNYPFVAGVWYHVAAVVDGVNIALYVNGSPIGNSNMSFAGAGSNTNVFCIGTRSVGSNYFNGIIDEVTVYNEALNSTEIQALAAGLSVSADDIPYYFYTLEETAASPSLSGWNRRNLVRIDNTEGGRLFDYQARVILNASQEGLWQEVRSDGYDIRFVDSDNETILKHWRTDFDYENKTASFWVKVPAIPEAAEKTIYLYYGKADAADTSSYAQTMTKDFQESGHNTSALALDGLDAKATVPHSASLNLTDAVTLEAQVRYDIGYWPEGWDYRRKVTLDNSTDKSRTSALVEFEVPYQAGMQADYADIRFWETDHSAKIRYRIIEYDAEKAVVWAYIPLIPANTQKEIYLYYGNAAAVSESDSDIDFLVLTQFGDSEVDTDKFVSLYTYFQNSYQVYLRSNTRAWGSSYLGVKEPYLRREGLTFQWQANQNSNHAYNQVMMGLKDDSGTMTYQAMPYAIFLYQNDVRIYEDGTNRGTMGTISTNTWYDFKIALKQTEGARYYYKRVDETDWTLLYDSDYSSETQLRPHIDKYGSNNSNSYLTYTRNWLLPEARDFLLYSPELGAQETEPATLKWLPGFEYRRKITLDNSGNTTLVERPVQIEVYYVEGKMNADYSDLRFVDTDGNKLRYRVASYDESKASVFVQMPLVPANTQKEIYLYYGNAAAVSESDPDVDDSMLTKFGNTAIDADKFVSLYTYFQNSYQVYLRSNTRAWGSSYLGVKEPYSRREGLTFQWQANQNSSHNYNRVMMGIKDNSETMSNTAMPYAIYLYETRILVYEDGTSRGDVGTFSINTWYDFKIVLKEAQGARYYYKRVDETDWVLLYDSDYSSETQLRPHIDKYGSYNSNSYLTYTRNWLLPEPAVLDAVFDNEEAQPAINQTIIGKGNAYSLKFTQAGLTAQVNDAAVSTVSYEPGRFIHAAMSYDRTRLRLFVEGIEKGSIAVTDAINTNANPLIIGEGLKGALDEARVWNITRPVGAISGDQRKWIAGDKQGLALYLMFNENSGTSAGDATVNGNNAALSGAASWLNRSFAYANEKAYALYHLDDGAGLSALDASGNANHLSLNQVNWSSEDLTGFPGAFSASFNGINAYMQAVDSDSLDMLEEVTMLAWVKPTDITGMRIIAEKGDDTNDEVNYSLMQFGDRIGFRFYNVEMREHVSAIGGLSVGVVSHIAATYNSRQGQVNLYINGEKIHEAEETAVLIANNRPLYFGRSVEGNYYAGLLDEVRIYNRTLPQEEIMAHYQKRQYAQFEPEPVQYFQFEPEESIEIGAYAKNNPVIQPVIGVFYTDKNLAEFLELANKPPGTEIRYQASPDGYNWYWHNGAEWALITGGYSQANTAAQINANLEGFQDQVKAFGEFFYRAYLHSSEMSFNTPSLEQIGMNLVTGETFYTDLGEGISINTIHTDASNDRWYQYRTLFYSDGESTPILDDVNIKYIPAFIEVTAPNGMEMLSVGDEFEITWASRAITGATGNVKLEYSVDNGNIYKLIDDNIANIGSYTWTVPDDPSANALVRVSSEDFPVVRDASDATFRILSLAVTSPDGGEIWEAGKRHPITWTTSGVVSDNLTIQYSKDSGAEWTNISTQRPNTGAYTWIIPQAALSDTLLIRIFDANNPNIIDTSDNVFAVVPVPAISITSPLGEEEWMFGTGHIISWQTNQSQFSDEVILEFSIDDFAEDIQDIASDVSIGVPQGENPGDIIIGSYQWDIPDAISDAVRIRVKEAEVPPGRDTQSIVSAISNSFSIIDPIVTITAPHSESIWVAGDTHTITWATEGTVSDNLLLEYSVDEGEAWAEIAESLANSGTYSWLVPDEAAGDSVYVRITDSSRPSINNVSEGFTVLGYPAIKIITPNGGESLIIGTQYEIRWESWGTKLKQGGADYFAISLYYSIDNGSLWELISDQQANNGSYMWSVPDFESTQCLVKIIDDNDTEIFDVSDSVFSIELPIITLTVPVGGEEWYATGDYEITWTSVGTVSDDLKLEYSANGGTSWSPVATGIANTGSYLWSAADVETASALVRITDNDRPETLDASGSVFSIKPPQIRILVPGGGEEWVAGTEHQFTWASEGGEYGAIRHNLTFQYSTDSGQSWETFAVDEMNDGSYLWTIPEDISQNYRLKIFDATRPATSAVSDEFAIVLPFIEILTPQSGAQWRAGTEQDIAWRWVGSVGDTVRMEYSIDNFDTAKTIEISVENTGNYTWTVTDNPDDISTSAKIRITSIVNEDVFAASAFFQIARPRIRMLTPNGGEQWTVGDTEQVTWENIGSVGSPVRIEYSKDYFATPEGIELIEDNILNTGSYGWEVPADFSDTVRVRVSDPEWGISGSSAANFAILPIPTIDVISPQKGDMWRYGTQQEIAWQSNEGLIKKVNIKYSANEGSTWKDIAPDLLRPDGDVYTWTVPDDISFDSMVRVELADPVRMPQIIGDSGVFRIEHPLINITSPHASTVWAVNDPATIIWETEGYISPQGQANFILDYSIDNGQSWESVSSDIATDERSYFPWTVPDYPVSNALVRVRDGGRLATTGISNEFQIIPAPTITVENVRKADGSEGHDFVLGDIIDIIWSWKGLDISNNLSIDYSNDGFINTRYVIAHGVANTGSFQWQIPENALTGTTLQVRITDANRTEIRGQYGKYFTIKGGLILITPNGGELWTAKSVQTVAWQTRGRIDRVNIEYTTDSINWFPVTSNLANSNYYLWTLPDIKTESALIRISDVDYDASMPDQSNTFFSLVYAPVEFRILDYDSIQHLDDVSANEPSTGWQDTGLSSPIMAQDGDDYFMKGAYSYGTYTTFFTKTDFIDNSATWSPPRSYVDIITPYVVTVYLENAASAQISWDAILTYSFAPATDSLNAIASLQRRGRLVGTRDFERQDMGPATLTIYEPDDSTTIRAQLIANTPSESGFYNLTYMNTDFEAGYVYPATLTIIYREQEYTSAANIDVGSEILQYHFFAQTAVELARSVEAIEKAVGEGSAQTIATLSERIDTTTAEIKRDTADLLVVTREELTKQVDIRHDQALDLMEARFKSEILNRENSVRSGQVLTIRYRTYSGLSPTIDVYDAQNRLRVLPGGSIMQEVTTPRIGQMGIYEATIQFSSGWGRGDFTIICQEDVHGSIDAIVISVIRTDMDTISGDVSAVLGATSGLSGLGKVAQVMESQFNMIESVLSRLGRSLVSEVKDALSSAEGLSAVHSQLSTVASQIKEMAGETGINLERLYEISRDKEGDILYLRNTTQRLKAAMDINAKLIDNIANKPVTTVWYEYR